MYLRDTHGVAAGDLDSWRAAVSPAATPTVWERTSCSGCRGGSIAAIKRLLREVFADLIALKQKVEDLTPK